MKGIISSYSTLRGLIYIRKRDDRNLKAGLTPRNTHESVTLSITINTQPAYLIDKDLLCAFFINIWLKRRNSRCSLLFLSDGDEFT